MSTSPRVVHDDTLEDLLVRTAGGDTTAFARFYDRLAPRVFGLVRRVVRDPGLAEDVLQEVMTELWRTAPRFDPARGQAVSWTLTLAHRRAVDAVRREQSARDRADVVGRREDAVRPFDQVAEEVDVAQDRGRVRAALAVLTDLQRQAIELAYFDGLTYREVAERLGVPLGTVKTRMRDGMIRLRDTLEVGT